MSGGTTAAQPAGSLGSTFLRLAGFLRTRPKAMAASIALGLLAALLGLAWQLGVVWLILEAMGPAPDRARMGWAVAWIAGLVVAGRLAFLGSTALSHAIAIDVQRDLRLALAEHLVRVPMAVCERYGPKALRRLVLDDVESVEDGVAHLVPEASANFTAPLVVLGVLFALDWRMALAAALPIVLGFVAMRSMTRDSADITRAYYERSAEMAARAAEYAAGLPTLRLFDGDGRSLLRFRAVSDRYLAVIGDWVRRVLLASAVLQVCVGSGLLLVLPLGLWLTARGDLPVSHLIVFLVFAPSLGGLITRLPNFALRFAQQGEVLSRIDALLAEPPLPVADVLARPAERTVRFEDVGFRRGDRRVLDGIDLVLEPGTVTALVGASGAGKTTLANLLMRFHDPQEGRITIGGVDLRAMAPETLYALVGTVPQHPWLFTGTVAENLRLAAPEATPAALSEALAQARADRFVAGLPGGLDAPLDRGGATLSGGERQRLCVARALLHDAPILVLDEATAAADPINEREIQRALGALARGRTVLVIAHRLASIVDADRIVVLDRGRIIESGDHRALLAKGGRYARYWALQNPGTPAGSALGEENAHAARA
ncbi:ABC transporter ATP-binding protein [Methylobacterium sp. E-045]|uniref:ABC transporter ATP-binding protein n=1 Tax=Methylobacterium sp. E-045 TaxID=2836575 RepID=UPI001FB9A9B7|nr:ABC transporter ATP-binding protein [Methylobacterium sp. E-045]MCJ2129807.1 ABC transporter ATP-binding protein/permease [Methylobacterium sp. E-045]